MRNLITFSVLIAMAVLAPATRSNAALMVGGQLWPFSNPTDDSTDSITVSDPQSISISQLTTYPGLTDTDPLQVFNGRASAWATPDSYHLETSLELQNYLRSNFVWITEIDGNGEPYTYVTTTALSSVTMTDTITVAGGTGVYSLNYVLGLDGLISSDNPLMSAVLQISLSLPEGVGTTTFYSFTPYSGIPSEITLTYDDLPFGGPVNPTLAIYAYLLPQPLNESDLPSTEVLTASGSVQFGSTVTLNKLTATDPNGNPIAGLTLSSSSSYIYPTDPGNLNQGINPVPEPSTLTMFAMLGGMGLITGFRRRRRGLTSRGSDVHVDS